MMQRSVTVASKQVVDVDVVLREAAAVESRFEI